MAEIVTKIKPGDTVSGICEMRQIHTDCEERGGHRMRDGELKTIIPEATINIKSCDAYYGYGYCCSVCGNSVSVRYVSEAREICPECARRLKKLLYPEEKDG